MGLFQKFGTRPEGPAERLPAPPPRNLTMISRQQDRWNDKAPKFRRTGVLRILQKSVGKGIILRRLIAPQDVGKQASHGIYKYNCGRFTAGKHEVPYRNFHVHEQFPDAFVDALIASADDDQTILGGKFPCQILIQRPSAWCRQDHLRSGTE